MRYPSQKSRWFSILIWGVIIILIISIFIIPADIRMIAVIGSTSVIAMMLWIWFGTYYEFRDTYLLARMGPFFERIPYERVVSAKPFHSLASSMALSSEMIELRHGKNYISGTTMISPEHRDRFLDELRERCPNLH